MAHKAKKRKTVRVNSKSYLNHLQLNTQMCPYCALNAAIPTFGPYRSLSRLALAQAQTLLPGLPALLLHAAKRCKRLSC